eukprot:1762056-Prymnesium_polylepis.1
MPRASHRPGGGTRVQSRGESIHIPAGPRKFRSLLFNTYASKHFVTTNKNNYSSNWKVQSEGLPCDRVTMAAHRLPYTRSRVHTMQMRILH